MYEKEKKRGLFFRCLFNVLIMVAYMKPIHVPVWSRTQAYGRKLAIDSNVNHKDAL